jgi:hypothetical protein
MDENDGTSDSRDLETVFDHPIGIVEGFIRERPLMAVAMSLLTGVFLARRLFRTRPDDAA